METQEHDLHYDSVQRVKINRRRCVVCGTLSALCFGKLFYQTGRSKFGAPFYKEHAAHFNEYASPVFENPTAQNLFKYMYPKTYQKKVEGNRVLYFDTYKRKAATHAVMNKSRMSYPSSTTLIDCVPEASPKIAPKPKL